MIKIGNKVRLIGLLGMSDFDFGMVEEIYSLDCLQKPDRRAIVKIRTAEKMRDVGV